MKKLTLTVLTIFAFTFVACEVEPVDSTLESVEGKGKIKTQKVKEPKETETCAVNLLPTLPSLVNACTTAKGSDANNAYFDLTISDTELAGDYASWCIDQDATLEAGQCFLANVYSSYDVLPEGVFEKPENFDLVNWLYNQNLIGTASSNGELFTFGDFQRAIWYLVDDSNCQLCLYLGDWDEERALEMVELAFANGEGYEPGPSEKLIIILVPTDGKQSVFIPYELECEPEPTCETAFARGTDGNTCFIGEGFSRWGWSIGPLSDGTEESYKIYAGAGQCDTSKGVLVGTVDVSYVDGNVSVTYNIDEGYTVSETHTYAGSLMFPLDNNGVPTVAPGQYYIEDNLSGDIHVIAHAVVCED